MEKLGYADIAERQRSAMAQEGLTRSAQSETNRSNLARESEQNRTNVANETLNLLRHQETIRSNMASEEIGRYNAVSNRINAQAAVTSAGAAVTNSYASLVGSYAAYKNSVTNSAGQKETVRHNMTYEGIQSNSNPWVSIATTLNKIVPGVANWVSNTTTALKSIGPKTTTLSNVVSKIVGSPAPKPSNSRPNVVQSGSNNPKVHYTARKPR